MATYTCSPTDLQDFGLDAPDSPYATVLDQLGRGQVLLDPATVAQSLAERSNAYPLAVLAQVLHLERSGDPGWGRLTATPLA